MAPPTTCDGDVYLHNLATFIKSHERQLANALLAYKKQPKGSQQQQQLHLQQLNSKPVRLSLTLHHAYYLLERFQDLGISVGPMNIRLENIHNDDTSLNYVSFLSEYHQNKRMSSDAQSIHSMSSVKSVMSSVSALWSSMGNSTGGSGTYGSNSRDVLTNDLKYLYSAFTKLPCLRLAPDSRAKLIEGHEEDPFDTAVPLKTFKNLSVLEVYDFSLKEIYGWHLVSEQIKFLVLKKTNITDPVEVLIELVEEDANLRGTAQAYDDDTISQSASTSTIALPKHPSVSSSSSLLLASSPSNNSNAMSSTTSTTTNASTDVYHPSYYHYQKKPSAHYSKHHSHYPLSSSYNVGHSYGSAPDYHPQALQRTSPTMNHASLSRQHTNDESTRSRKNTASSVMLNQHSSSSTPSLSTAPNSRRSNTLYMQSTSPPSSSNHLSVQNSTNNGAFNSISRRARRSNSNASDYSIRSRSSPTPPPQFTQPRDPMATAWRQLKHLSFTENNIVTITDYSFEPLQSLTSLDLSRNKLRQIPSALRHLKNLKSLNLSYNLLESTEGFQRDQLPKLTILNLKSNKLKDLTSLEFLKNLQKLDLRSNKLELNDLKPLLMGTKPLKLQLLFLQNNNVRNYRIELFNLFNGIDYNNSLKIDGSRPGIFESRLLFDSKNAEAKLNKFFISQIANSISTMSLAQAQTATAIQPIAESPPIAVPEANPSHSVPEASGLASSPTANVQATQLAPYNQDKDYVLLPPFKPFVRPVLKAKSSEETLTSSPAANKNQHVADNTSTSSGNGGSIIHSPSLILKDPVKATVLSSEAMKQSHSASIIKTAPTSPHTSMFPLMGSNTESPRTVSSTHSLASKLNRMSNDLSSIVATSNNSHDLLSQKLGSPAPPIITPATSTVNSNSNASSQRTSIVSTKINTSLGKENSRSYDNEDYATTTEHNEPTITSNPNINPAILYLMNNE